LTIREYSALAAGEYLKVGLVDATNNRFTVECGDEGNASTDIIFFYEVFN